MALVRMVAIAAGYEDCDDIDALRADPAFKIACGRAPESGLDPMSQPTLSRLENLADRRVLMAIGLAFIDLFCNSWTRVPDCIVLDIDDTDDPAHGQQILAVFNAHVGATCFQPMLSFEGHLGQARDGADPARQAAVGQRDRLQTAPRDRPHPYALAAGENRASRYRLTCRICSGRPAGTGSCPIGTPTTLALPTKTRI